MAKVLNLPSTTATVPVTNDESQNTDATRDNYYVIFDVEEIIHNKLV